VVIGLDWENRMNDSEVGQERTGKYREYMSVNDGHITLFALGRESVALSFSESSS
jgi:hypothetical protein